MSMKIMPTIQKVYFLIIDSPYFTIETVAAVVIPLILVALMFNWRVKQSMKKQKKFQKRRENLLKKLNESRGAKDEKDDEVLNEAIRLMEAKAKKSN